MLPLVVTDEGSLLPNSRPVSPTTYLMSHLGCQDASQQCVQTHTHTHTRMHTHTCTNTQAHTCTHTPPAITSALPVAQAKSPRAAFDSPLPLPAPNQPFSRWTSSIFQAHQTRPQHCHPVSNSGLCLSPPHSPQGILFKLLTNCPSSSPNPPAGSGPQSQAKSGRVAKYSK